jgi:hypothetical protein
MALGRTDHAAVDDIVLPQPVVTWVTVVQANDPTREATPGRLRELRKKHRVAAGVTVPRRGKLQLEGRATYYSVLSVLAARSRQEGREDTAAEMVRAAEQLETNFSDHLRKFLSDHALSELPTAGFFDDLCMATAERVAEWREHAKALLAVARVDEITGDLAHLEGISSHGVPVAVDLPRALLERQALTIGDLVWVFNRFVGDAALVELLPAMRLTVQIKSYDAKLWMLADWDNLANLSSSVKSATDGLSDDESREFADRYSATIAAKPNAEDLARLRGYVAAGKVPRRRLRPAG